MRCLNTGYLIPAILTGLAGILTACGGGGSGAASAPATFTISGTVSAAAGTAADSDVNDPAAPFADNSSTLAPQDIPNPVTVGGYVNQTSAGPPGRSGPGQTTVLNDASDVYRATLTAGQTITLTEANAGGGDLDLLLGDSGGTIVASSGTPANLGGDNNLSETIVVPSSGTFFIEVHAATGASNYSLVLGQDITSTYAGKGPSLTDDFVIGEAIVKFRSGINPSATATKQTGVSNSTDREIRISLSSVRAASGKTVVTQYPVLVAGDMDMRAKWDTLQEIRKLNNRPDVEYAEPNYIRRPLLTPNDPLYATQWHYPLIHLPQAWDITTGSAGVIVAVIDTGILGGHPDLLGQTVPGYDFISDVANANDGNGIDNDPQDPGDSGVGASSFHGTHVAGTVAAATGNMTGVAGTCWNCRIMPLRALGLFGGSSYDIRQAILFAAGMPNDSGTTPAQPADIINLSLGGEGFSQADQDLFDQVRAAGIIVVAAAGNNTSNVPFYPASYNNVVSVSAVDINRQPAPYSNFGPAVDVAAPGGNSAQDINGDGNPDAVLSSGGDDSGALQYNYRFLQGTSMATPHVAGVAALMKSVDPALTPVQFDSLLAGLQLTVDLGNPGRDDRYGYGLIDAHKAVVAAQGGGSPVPPTLVVSPGSLNFGNFATNATLTAVNGGGGTLNVSSVTDNAAWLTVTPDGGNPGDGTGSYHASIDRTGLADGTYNAVITFTWSDGGPDRTETVNIIMQVASFATSGDAGFHYISLIDSSNGNVVDQVALAASNGTYPFTFSNVPAGTYEIIAGTDNNNDLFICDAGEACGGYTTLDQPTQIMVDTNISGLDFVTGYNITVNSAAATTTTPALRRVITRKSLPNPSL